MNGYLGSGAFGNVYAVNGKAVKRSDLFRPCDDKWTLVTEVLNEAVFALWCKEQMVPGLVEYHSATLDRNNLEVHIRQQLMSGDLHDFIDTYPDATRRAMAPAVLEQLLIGAAGMHLVGLMHGDLKPNNVLVTANEPGIQVVIADLGAAFMYKDAPLEPYRDGTYTYLPPESFSSVKPASAEMLLKADSWALGTLMHEFVLGHSSMCADFVGNLSFNAIGNLHRAGKVVCHPACPDGLDGGVFRAIQSLLHTDPAERVSITELYSKTERGEIRLMTKETVVIDPVGDTSAPMTRSMRIDALHDICSERCFALAVNLADRFATVSPVVEDAHLHACAAITFSVLCGSGTDMDVCRREAVMDVLEAVQLRVYGDTCDELLLLEFRKLCHADVRSALKRFSSAAAAAEDYRKKHPVIVIDS